MNQNTLENLQFCLLMRIKTSSPELSVKSQYSFEPNTITLSYLIKYDDWDIRASKTVRRNKILPRAQYVLTMSKQDTYLDLTEYNTSMAHRMFAAIRNKTKAKQ